MLGVEEHVHWRCVSSRASTRTRSTNLCLSSTQLKMRSKKLKMMEIIKGEIRKIKTRRMKKRSNLYEVKCHTQKSTKPFKEIIMWNMFLGDIHKGVTTSSRIANFCENYSFVSSLEPLKVEDALRDLDWVVVVQEELKFKRNEVWNFVLCPIQNVVGTKWVFRNKQDEHGVVTRNKDRLVANGYSQVKGLDFNETFAHIARLESIRILLTYATYHDFKLFQMNVKSAFLNGPIKEEVYVEQPPSFKDDKYPKHVFKLNKVLCGFKQAPREWYGCLRVFLIAKHLRLGKSILLCSLRRLMMFCSYAKFMLMSLYLVILTTHLVESLVGLLWSRSLIC
jgi:hypothetical protein